MNWKRHASAEQKQRLRTGSQDLHVTPSDHNDRTASGERPALSSEGLGWSGLTFERHDIRRGSRNQPEGSPHHSIFVGLSSGQVIRETGGGRIEHTLAPGRVLIIPARTPVRWTWTSRIGFSVLTLEPGLLDRLAQEAFQLGPDRYRLPVAERRSDTVVANIVAALTSEALSRDHAGNVCAISLANILSVHLLRHYATDANGGPLTGSGRRDLGLGGSETLSAAVSRPVAQALQFIQENYARDVGLSDIAAAAYVSPFHLSHLFRQTLGISPYQHVLLVRVNSAQHLLAAGLERGSLAEIANAVGFADQSHLTRHFKRLTGVTPGQFGANHARWR